MGMSKYTRFKLKAHDRGEDRHNKGVSLLKKQSRLDREHQAALQSAKRQRATRVKAERVLRKEWSRQRGTQATVEKLAQSLVAAAPVDLQPLDLRPPVRRWPEKVKMEREPVTIGRTYRIRRLDDEEVTEVQVAVKSVVLHRRPM